MAYRKTTTAAKIATPAGVIIGGTHVLQFVSGLLGVEMEPETAFTIITTFYSMGAGLINWLKHRKR